MITIAISVFLGLLLLGVPVAFCIGAADHVDGFAEIIHIDVNLCRQGTPEPVGTPYSTVLLLLPAVAAIHANLVI